MLLLVIAAMVVVDLVFLVIVTAVDSSRFYATEQRVTVGLSLTTKLLSGSSIARNDVTQEWEFSRKNNSPKLCK